MKSDRELLELAAKAAGLIDPKYCELSGDEPAMYVRNGLGASFIWAPLADDGDRHRLMRDLGLAIDFAECTVWKRLSDRSLIQEYWGGDCGDEAHAVLRAAAAIGERME